MVLRWRQDAVAPNRQMFGERRLLEILDSCSSLDPQQAADAVMKAVSGFRGDAEQVDDETIVIVDRR